MIFRSLFAFLIVCFGVHFGTSITFSAQQKPAEFADQKTRADLVFQCDFEQSSDPTSKDLNYDNWPDLWKRKKGRGFPAYSKMEIRANASSKNQRAFFVGLDGGQAAVFSPKIPVDGTYSYVLNGLVKTISKPGHNCKAYATLTYFDQSGKQLKRLVISPSKDSKKGFWFPITTKLLTLSSDEITHMMIGLHVDPVEETSLFGECWFDEIKLYQYPRIELNSGSDLNVFTNPKEVVLKCRVSGARRNDAGLKIDLYDEHGNLLRSDTKKLTQYLGSDGQQKRYIKKGKSPNGLEWRLVNDPELGAKELLRKYRGFYRIVITLLDREEEDRLVRNFTFVVVKPVKKAGQNLFGWSLPVELKKIDADSLSTTLRRLAINWVKMPIWLNPEDHKNLQFHSTMIQKMNRRGLEVVGVLDTPPKEVYKKYWQQEQGIAALTNDMSAFLSAVEPILSHLRIRVSRWQIGADDDTSLSESSGRQVSRTGRVDGMADNQRKMKEISEFFLKYGEETKVGLPWRWLAERPDSDRSKWHFDSTIAYPELSKDELQEYILSSSVQSAREHWVAVQPLSSDHYTLLTRVRDLVDRLIEVKRLGVKRVFCPRPFEKHNGFFDTKNMPTEVLVPWQVMGDLLNGSEYLGSIYLPGGSTNHLFEKDGKACMLLWNDAPTKELLYLGREITAVDMWGREVEVRDVDQKTELTATPWPILVENLDLGVAKTRLSVQFDKLILASIVGRKQPLELSFKNYFSRGISGSISVKNETIFVPEFNVHFKVNRETKFKYSIPVRMRRNSLTGDQLVQVDFKFHYQELRPFSAWLPLRVGLESVEFATRKRMTKDGNFVVKLTCINRSNHPISYIVHLAVPDRRWESIMFLDVRPGQESKLFTVYDAKKLIGRKFWIHAKEARGQRTLNYHIEIEP